MVNSAAWGVHSFFLSCSRGWTLTDRPYISVASQKAGPCSVQPDRHSSRSS